MQQVAGDVLLVGGHGGQVVRSNPERASDLSVRAELLGLHDPSLDESDTGADLRGGREDATQVGLILWSSTVGSSGSTSASSRSAMSCDSGANASRYPI